MIAAVRKSSAPYNWYAHRQLTFAALFIHFFYFNCDTLGDEITECKTTTANSTLH